jgi:hypothetical protein
VMRPNSGAEAIVTVCVLLQHARRRRAFAAAASTIRCRGHRRASAAPNITAATTRAIRFSSGWYKFTIDYLLLFDMHAPHNIAIEVHGAFR